MGVVTDADVLAAALDRGEHERVRVALHEAGHAACAYVVGGSIGVVSIRPTERWGGVAYTDEPAADFVPDEFDPDDILPLWPPTLRARLELSIIVSYAGPLAERALTPPPRGCRGEPSLVRQNEHARLERAVVALNKPERAMLAQGDVPDAPRLPSDETRAAERAAVLAPGASGPYLAVLRAEAARLVGTRRFGHLCRALAAELLEHTDLGGVAATAVLEAADQPQRKEPTMAVLKRKRVTGDAPPRATDKETAADKPIDPKQRCTPAGRAGATTVGLPRRGRSARRPTARLAQYPEVFVPADTPQGEWPTRSIGSCRRRSSGPPRTPRRTASGASPWRRSRRPPGCAWCATSSSRGPAGAWRPSRRAPKPIEGDALVAETGRPNWEPVK